MNTKQYKTSEQLFNHIKKRIRPCFFHKGVEQACSDVTQIQTKQKMMERLLDEPLVRNDPSKVTQVHSTIATLEQDLAKAKERLQSYLTQEEE